MGDDAMHMDFFNVGYASGTRSESFSIDVIIQF